MANSTLPPIRVLVADLETASRRELARALLARGQEVLTAESGEAALALARSEPLDVALVSASLRGPGGESLLAMLRSLTSPPEVIAVTAPGEATGELLEQGAWAAVEKGPGLAFHAATAILRAHEQRKLREELARRGHENRIVGSHRLLKQALREVAIAATSRKPVHLWGEPGSGKRLLAQHLHELRGGGAWVELLGTSLPDGALEPGSPVWERARGGTLYLSDVDALPTTAQLLLEHFVDLSHRTIALITSSRGSLYRAAREGSIRPELSAKLTVVQIHVPPLRLRRDDIPSLAHHFLLQATQRDRRDVKRISPEALRQLRALPWPGNVRDLKLTIERAVLFCRGDTIFPGDLAPPTNDLPQENYEVAMTTKNDFTGLSLPPGWDELPYSDAKERALDSFHAAYLGALLRRTGGNISEAARRAGLDRSNFRRVLKRYGNPLAPRGDNKLPPFNPDSSHLCDSFAQCNLCAALCSVLGRSSSTVSSYRLPPSPGLKPLLPPPRIQRPRPEGSRCVNALNLRNATIPTFWRPGLGWKG
ncbi:MAG: response regulator [Myxococcales bacterium]|nr:response regulator [Polyangiaceae bacterium]MDW8250160.1 response regulator [Myxococcales bacterium]